LVPRSHICRIVAAVYERRAQEKSMKKHFGLLIGIVVHSAPHKHISDAIIVHDDCTAAIGGL